MKKSPLTYSHVGDDYDTKDPIKKMALDAARETGGNLKAHKGSELAVSRGESAYIWSPGKTRDKHAPLMASVVEGLGTKNLVADAMYRATGKTYYDVIGHDTVATIINDLTSVGATPLVIHAYWAIENNTWLQDKKRMRDLIKGWKQACYLAGVSWGGGETPTLKGIVTPDTIDLAGSAVGIIQNKKQLPSDKKIRRGDRIVLLQSSGINANGLSLARAVADTLPRGYMTKISDGQPYGDALLTKTHIYAKALNAVFDKDIDVHYISNITGHGLRKLMRGRPTFSYIIERIVTPPLVFDFIQQRAHISLKEMYQTFNMGMDYALYLPEKEVKQAQKVFASFGFASIDAGFVETGPRQVVITPLGLTYSGSTLNLR